ncbi:MAGE-like protein 2 [Perognathus longimembris pacificus]|uniref:MAGE-like protein 2 n=1 Tax=Perognathus longimembris pacificus TaxID=214514 RepID=UPI00201A16B5|nr:MAGE-like protein 2 [Perognathus longimembris pacificus]
MRKRGCSKRGVTPERLNTPRKHGPRLASPQSPSTEAASSRSNAESPASQPRRAAGRPGLVKRSRGAAGERDGALAPSAGIGADGTPLARAPGAPGRRLPSLHTRGPGLARVSPACGVDSGRPPACGVDSGRPPACGVDSGRPPACGVDSGRPPACGVDSGRPPACGVDSGRPPACGVDSGRPPACGVDSGRPPACGVDSGRPPACGVDSGRSSVCSCGTESTATPAGHGSSISHTKPCAWRELGTATGSTLTLDLSRRPPSYSSPQGPRSPRLS